uniref:Uncharacterized protein n=1 Tax=Glossina palpalis gambiensis TaxID=67801 RepID=A0A1B0ATN7_9MUSC
MNGTISYNLIRFAVSWDIPPSNLYMTPSVIINARSACLLCLLNFLENDENRTLLKPSPASLFLRFLTLELFISDLAHTKTSFIHNGNYAFMWLLY